MATQLDFLELDGTKVPLIYEQDKRLPIASMQLVFRNSGSITDGALPGLAKISAKMMNEGTKSLGSIGFAKALDAKAIHMSANVGTETFVIEMGSLTDEFSEGIELMKSLLKDPNLTDGSLQKVKAVTLGSIKRKESDYDYVANELLKAILFEETPLAEPAIGTEASVEKIDVDDVKHFLQEHLVRSRAIIVVGGDLTHEQAKVYATSLLDTLEPGDAGTLGHHVAAPTPKEKVLKRPTEQAYLYFGSPYDLSVGDKEAYKSRVATYVLGTGGFGSRLMEEIRVKRGLAYSAYARVNVSNSNTYFMGYLQTKIDSLDEAKSTVKEVIDTFVHKGVTQAELDQAKKFLLGSEPLHVETLSQRLSRTFMEYYKGEELGYSKAELEKIRTLSLEDLNSYIGKHKEILDLSFAIVTEDKQTEKQE